MVKESGRALRTGVWCGLAVFQFCFSYSILHAQNLDEKYTMAQNPKAALVKLAVIDVQDYMARSSGDTINLVRGNAIIELPLKTVGESALKKTKRLQIRVFRESKNYLINHHQASAGDCYIYYSKVIKISADNWERNKLSVTKIDKTWLGAKNGQIRDQEITLVFEDSDKPDSVLTIHKDSVKDYFSRGYEMLVKNNSELTRDQQER